MRAYSALGHHVVMWAPIVVKTVDLGREVLGQLEFVYKGCK